MVSFSQLPAVKKDTIFGAARKIFGPSYFATALVQWCLSCEYWNYWTLLLFLNWNFFREINKLLQTNKIDDMENTTILLSDNFQLLKVLWNSKGIKIWWGLQNLFGPIVKSSDIAWSRPLPISNKVSKFQNEFMKSSFLPKYEPKIVPHYRAEILTIFGSYSGRNEDFINSFWNLLIFS